MPLKLYKKYPGDETSWWVRGTIQGRLIKRSTGTHIRAQAEEVRAHIEADEFKRGVYGDKAVATFAEATIAYIHAGGEAEHLDKLVLALGDRLLKDINQSVVDGLARLRPGLKPSTYIRQIYTPVSAVVNFAHSQGLCDPLRLRKPKVRNSRTDYLTPKQAEAWIESLPPYLSQLFVFYLGAGCRASEALGLDWKDVSEDGRVVLWETKGGYARSLQLGQRALSALPERPRSNQGPVFLNSRGEPWHGYDAINLMLKRHRANHPDLEPVHCHLLRHTWATWAYAVTRDLTFVMAQGGWRSLAILGRYTHAGSSAMSEDVLAHGWTYSGPKWNERPQKAA